MVFTDDALDAAVELYYDVAVEGVSPQEAARIKRTNPTQVVFENRP